MHYPNPLRSSIFFGLFVLILNVSRMGMASTSGPTPQDVIKAIKAQNSVKLEKMFDTGIPADFKVEGDWTTLHFAADTGNVKIGKMLIGYGANVNAESLGGELPLHRAAWKGHLPFVKLLLDFKSRTDVVSEGEKTPLQLAQSMVKISKDPKKTKIYKSIVALLKAKTK